MLILGNNDLSRRLRIIDKIIARGSRGSSLIKDILATFIVLDQLLYSALHDIFPSFLKLHQLFLPRITFALGVGYLVLLVFSFVMPRVGLNWLQKQLISVLRRKNPGAFADMFLRDTQQIRGDLRMLLQNAHLETAEELAIRIAKSSSGYTRY